MTKHPALHILNKLKACHIDCLTYLSQRLIDILDGSEVDGLHLLSSVKKTKAYLEKMKIPQKGK